MSAFGGKVDITISLLASKEPRRPVQERRGPTVAVTGGIHWDGRPRAVIKPIQADDWRSFRAWTGGHNAFQSIEFRRTTALQLLFYPQTDSFSRATHCALKSVIASSRGATQPRPKPFAMSVSMRAIARP